ncbi:MAG TPA: 5-methyltetrahydropteroyltriglutamate--homocysteine S-methyltransferase [Candidatus Binatia bacterium]|jgi:5-methyltetrahydropteroyltriglutamate--homocysteine methyltransferase|nr:5-methyltetrahydropteroyltriglutamate--homocysteine S-methyltransferase [Candidatus Binatia bacterium]
MANSAPHNPPFRAEHIGSLLRPPELLRARAEHEAGRLPAGGLHKLEDKLIRQAVAVQEEVGLQSITDGEYRRGVFYADFICRGLGGASVYYESERMFFIDDHGNKIAVPLIEIHDRLRWRGPIHVDDFTFVRPLTTHLVKVTIPSPTIVYTAAGEHISKEPYPDRDLLRADVVEAYQKELQALAGAGCRYVQLDEVPIALYCDVKRWGQMHRQESDARKMLSEVFPQLINDALAGRPASLHLGMHLCRGNNQSGWISEGGYDPVAEMLFNEINVDSYFLEYDTARAGTFEPLRFVPKQKSVVLGLVSSKLPQLEPKDELKRRIDEAAKYIDLDQLALSPQCGFASTAPGNRLTFEQQRAKLRLVVEVAHEVWG